VIISKERMNGWIISNIINCPLNVERSYIINTHINILRHNLKRSFTRNKNSDLQINGLMNVYKWNKTNQNQQELAMDSERAGPKMQISSETANKYT